MKVGTLISLVRYRFLLLAGLLPYLFGAALAFREGIDLFLFLLGLVGAASALIGVEAFNEYFEGRAGGADLVFDLEATGPVPHWVFWIGAGAFVVALGIALYVVIAVGPLILLFAIYGFLAAAFYVGPPFKWAYRGVGETVISLSYGPFMTLGSYYIQAGQIDLAPLTASLVPAFLTFAVVLSNEIPDYYGDRLVGKRNLVVRLGRRRATWVHQGALLLGYGALLGGVLSGALPLPSLLAFLTFPLFLWALPLALRNHDAPRRFIPAIRATVGVYTLTLLVLTVSPFLS